MWAIYKLGNASGQVNYSVRCCCNLDISPADSVAKAATISVNTHKEKLMTGHCQQTASLYIYGLEYTLIHS
jgi:hypothetical protein